MKIERRLFPGILLASFVCVSVPAYADGIDLVPYFTRIGGEHSVPVIVGLIACLMAANYLLNLLVIGLPAVKFGGVDRHKVVSGLILLTVLGQGADRLGALAAGFLATPLTTLIGGRSEGAWVIPLFSLNFLLSGVAVGGLAFYFLTRRWLVARRVSYAISFAAAVFTNPAWAMALWFV